MLKLKIRDEEPETEPPLTLFLEMDGKDVVLKGNRGEGSVRILAIGEDGTLRRCTYASSIGLETNASGQIVELKS
jgi:hypothetical protein